MEKEQISQKIDWLDAERRKDRMQISTLENRIIELEGALDAAKKQITDLSGEISQINALSARMDKYDKMISDQHNELSKKIEVLEKETDARDSENTKILRAEIKGYDSQISAINKELTAFSDVKRTLQVQEMEDQRLSDVVDKVRKEINDLQQQEEEQTRIFRLLEDNHKQESKRITDLQGEVTAVRKRSDEIRSRVDVAEIGLQKTDNRLNDLIATENDRMDDQRAFMEKQAMKEVERDRVWREWNDRFDSLEKQSSVIDNQIQQFDTTHRSVKRTQEDVEAVSERVERRVNELMEMQRLNEDRFRQEWVTFKADDQKRWTNYTLSQEEAQSEINRKFDRLTERVTILEDSDQALHDTMSYTRELTDKRINTLLALVNDWASEID